MVKNNIFNDGILRKDFVGNDTHTLITKTRAQVEVEDLLGEINQEANPSLEMRSSVIIVVN